MPSVEEPFKISVVGVGLAGACASILLSRLPGVELQAYERSAVPREAGGWLGVTPYAETIVHEMVGKEAFDAIVHRNLLPQSRHYQTGEVLVDPPMELRGNAAGLRNALHQLLLKAIPEGTVQGGMRAQGVSIGDSSVSVRFEGGEEVESDLVIVADGIRSRLRQSLKLESDITFSGLVEYMAVFDLAHVEHISNLPTRPAVFSNGGMEWLWCSRVGASQFGIIVSTVDHESGGGLSWNQDADADRKRKLQEIFKGWCPIVTDILSHIPEVNLFPVYRGEWLDELSFGGRVVLIGDAAHPTGGAYSAGAGLAFGDVKALVLALTHVSATGSLKDPVVLARALSLYDKTRQGLLPKVFESIKNDASQRDLMEQIGDDEDRVSQWMAGANKSDLGWLRYHNVEEEFHRVLESEGKKV